MYFSFSCPGTSANVHVNDVLYFSAYFVVLPGTESSIPSFTVLSSPNAKIWVPVPSPAFADIIFSAIPVPSDVRLNKELTDDYYYIHYKYVF